MDNRIAIGDKLELVKIDTRLAVNPDSESTVYVSQVLDEGEYDNILAAMPIQEGRMIPLGVDQMFTATFYTKQTGLLRCKVKVIGRYKKDNLFMVELEPQDILKKVQRREYFRFPCRTRIDYRIVDEPELGIIEAGDTYKPDDALLEWKNAIMLDLSGGGIYFVADVAENNGAMVEVRFNIVLGNKGTVVYSYAKIMRVERNQNKPTIYDHHIQFWRMEHHKREKIIRYIFEQQRKNRSQQLGKI
ncbi:MAG: flagellar brake domain-containing protein [Lachnospiraceae bacterium]|nr:flagellar brake domain-containing protein [Lachnospiraceae bacterium]MDE6627047.1 flagellar brake domain-containing protein [Lachnospiraceae bacterium]